MNMKNVNLDNSHCNVVGDNNEVNYYVSQEHGSGKSDEARKYLELMPTEKSAELMPLPEGSKFHFLSNDLYVGREEEITKIALLFKGESLNTFTQMVILGGVGGVGKTQLAVEFVCRHGHYFLGGVFWVNMEDKDQVESEILLCGDYLGLSREMEGLSLVQKVARVYREFQKDIPRLLIFDNCEDDGLLDDWMPPYGGTRVLVTTRKQDWDKTYKMEFIGLSSFSRSESLALLTGSCSRLQECENTADEIADFMGDLPLALHLAGSYLNTFKSETPMEYIQGLKSYKPSILHESLQGRGAKRSPTKHENNLYATFLRSFNKLVAEDSIDAASLRLFGHLVWFAHGVAVPLWLLLKCAGSKIFDGKNLDLGVYRLLELGIVTRVSEDSISIHRLIALFSECMQLDAAFLRNVEDAFFEECSVLTESKNPKLLSRWRNHMVEVVQRAVDRNDKQGAELAFTFGLWCKEINEFESAERWYKESLRIFLNLHGEENIDTAAAYNNLAGLLMVLGKLQEAKVYFEKALSFFKSISGGVNLMAAGTLTHIGDYYQFVGQNSLSYQCHLEALDIRIKIQNDDGPQVALSYAKLGSLFLECGDYTKAEGYFRKAFSIREKLFDEGHPDLCQSLNDLGIVLLSKGQYGAAMIFFKKALLGYENAYGEENFYIANVLENLARGLAETGELGEAERCLRRAIEIRENLFGFFHVDTVKGYNSLGCVYLKKKEYGEAERYYKKVISASERELIRNDQLVATVYNNLAALMKQRGMFTQAEVYVMKSISIQENDLGVENHLYRAAIQNLKDIRLKLRQSKESKLSKKRRGALKEKRKRKKKMKKGR